MARIAVPANITRELARKRGPLQTYQWLWMVFCVIGALAVAAPRIVTQPALYYSYAETRFDVSLYGGLYDAEGQPTRDFIIAKEDATHALTQHFQSLGITGFNSPVFRIDYIPAEPGVIEVRGTALEGASVEAASGEAVCVTAACLANMGSEELVRQIRAAGGREVLRNLLGHELVEALHGAPPETTFQVYLRDIIENDAFPLSAPIEPISERRRIEELQPEERNDVARALEYRDVLWTQAIDVRNATLDRACPAALTAATSAERRTTLESCATSAPTIAQELTYHDQAVERRETIRAALRYLQNELGLIFDPTAGTVSSVAATTTVPPTAWQMPFLLILTAVAGFVFGSAGVVLDRSAGVMAKLRELWAFRELIANLVLRDLHVRYKGSALGYLWTQLAPLLMMMVFWFVFSSFFQTPIAMFPLFLIVGLLPWNFCAEAVSGGARSILDNANLIKKVFFPREVLPLVSVLSSLVNFLLSLPMLFLVMMVIQFLYPPLQAEGRLNFSWTIAYLPVLLIIQLIFLTGVTFFLSTLAVFFRDVVHLIGILVQFWFFLTPVVYSLDIVSPEIGRIIRWANPMASLIEFYREILYGGQASISAIPTPAFPAVESVLRVFVTALIVLALGYWFFQRRSGDFGEEI